MAKKLFFVVYAISLILSASQNSRLAYASGIQTLPDFKAFAPIISSGSQATPMALVNAPYFPGNPSDSTYVNQEAVFWFGKVTPNTIYSDVRLAYTDQEVTVFITVFDRLLWYNPKSTPTTDLTQWDGASLYLNKSGVSNTSLNQSVYRFDGDVNWFEPRTNYQAAFQPNGANWSPAAVSFTTVSGYQGEGMFNSGLNSRGWAITYHIPFASLNLTSRPADGTIWGIGLSLHNRNSQAGPALPDTTWPEKVDLSTPTTWAALHFGIPTYTPPSIVQAGTTTIRQGLNGSTVPDGGVGGVPANQCPGDENFVWNNWGDANYKGETGFNIQNQSNIGDFPCFSKYYVTFPLSSMPNSKKILKATLVMYQWGGSGNVLGPGFSPEPSYVQVETLLHDFDPSTVSWNNGPQAYENVSATWVDPVTDNPPAWPGHERDWDVTRAVAAAYASGQPLRLAVYDSATKYNSGLYFNTSEAADWNAAGRPTLVITWGN